MNQINYKNTILFGVGPHSKRIYLDLIKQNNIKLRIVVDLKSKEFELRKLISNTSEMFFIDDNEKDYRELSENSYNSLKELCIKYAIISTEPKSHYAFTKFCLENNINILVDKPLTMPSDFINRENHPYKYGDGKLFHSGFHFVDMLAMLISLNNETDRVVNNVNINKSLLKINDFH